MNGSDAIKKYQTNMKSAQGVVVLAVVINLIYILRALISKNLNFWFSTYTTEYLMKRSGFGGYEGSLSKVMCIAIIIVQLALLVFFAAMSQKKGKCLIGCLVVYAADAIFMAVGYALDLTADFAEADIINIIYHAFVVIFIVGGIYSYKKLCRLMVKN